MNGDLPEILKQLMRPPGGGIPVFSAGKGAALRLQKKHYEAAGAKPRAATGEAIDKLWRDSFARIPDAKVVVIGVPLDTGAGIRRGAAYGPRAIREELLRLKSYRSLLRSGAVLDLGDVFVNPHLLHDGMLNDAQIEASRAEMYPDARADLRARLPVSALSQLQLILSTLLQAHPALRVHVLGGDHSVAWPVTEALSRRYPGTLGIVQPDAHTDLLASRLGVKYCFGTWSYHAAKLLGGTGKLVQIGIRQSGREKAHWEETAGVKQYWASEIRPSNEEKIIGELVSELRSQGIRQVYFSNDIDGTDEREASATGTPVAKGLRSKFVLRVIDAIGKNFELVASDVVEVAPDLAPNPKARKKTSELAARYSAASIERLLGE